MFRTAESASRFGEIKVAPVSAEMRSPARSARRRAAGICAALIKDWATKLVSSLETIPADPVMVLPEKARRHSRAGQRSRSAMVETWR
jgi:hypothetical protein